MQILFILHLSESTQKERMYHNKKMSKTCFWGAISFTDVLAALDGFYFHFFNSLKISTYYEYNFECGLLKSKTRTSGSLKVSNFKGCCNIEMTLFQIK